MKLCTGCSTTKPLVDFGRNRNTKDGYDHRCKGCRREYARSYYRANTSSYTSRMKRIRQECRDLVIAAKSVPCADCGNRFPHFVMDFDHRDPSTKLRDVSYLMNSGQRQAMIDEIAKCDVVCANCHRFRTQDRLPKQERAPR